MGKRTLSTRRCAEPVRCGRDDFLLLMDADIVLDLSCLHAIERLAAIAVCSETVTNKPFGLIAPMQVEADCHAPAVYQSFYTLRTSLRDAEKVYFPPQPSGIAGGCVLCSFEVWQLIGGYRPLGVYAGDDAFLLLDVGRAGYSYQVAADIHIIHPRDNDPEYAKWKMAVCHRGTNGVRKHDLTAEITEADLFWQDR